MTTDVCVVCGAPVTPRTRIEAIRGWTNVGTGEFVEDEVVHVLCLECYMRLSPAELSALFEQTGGDDVDTV